MKMMKNNELIAEFMDLRNTGMSIYKESEYKYHTSWDWLMPVILKIAPLTECGIKIQRNEKIRSAYSFVVEFIKEYNDGQGEDN